MTLLVLCGWASTNVVLSVIQHWSTAAAPEYVQHVGTLHLGSRRRAGRRLAVAQGLPLPTQRARAGRGCHPVARWLRGVRAARLDHRPACSSTTSALAEIRNVFPSIAAIAGAWPLPSGHTVEGVLTCLVRGPAAPAKCAVFAASSPHLHLPGEEDDSQGSLTTGSQSDGAPGEAAAPPFTWRSMLDLEHYVVFIANIHWNSLVGDAPTSSAPSRGHRINYIVWALWPGELLFRPHRRPVRARGPGHQCQLGARAAGMARRDGGAIPARGPWRGVGVARP